MLSFFGEQHTEGERTPVSEGSKAAPLREKGLRDMTQGNPWGHIFFFAMPLVWGNMLQQLYNMVDSWVVGNFVGDDALAAVGVGYPMTFLLAALFTGMANGAGVVIAQFYGAGRMDRVKDTVDTLYTAIVVAILPLTLFALLITRPLLEAMGVEDSYFQDALVYMLVVSAGIIGTIGYNCNSGILQGLGNSRASLLFLAIAAVMNIVLDLTFVLVFNWGVFGVAFATIISQACSWIFGLFYINRKYPEIAIHLFSRRFDKVLFRMVMRIGLPAGIQFGLISVGIMVIISQVNAYGKAFTAGFNVANKLDSMAFLPVQSFGAAVTTYTGQNIGAGKPERVRLGVRAALILSLIWCVTIALIMVPLGPAVVRLFNQNPQVVEAGTLMLRCIMPTYALFAVQFVLCAVMRGAGESLIPMLAAVCAQVAIRVPAVYLLSHLFGPTMMYYGFGIGWAFGAILATSYYLTGRWKRQGSLAARA